MSIIVEVTETLAELRLEDHSLEISLTEITTKLVLVDDIPLGIEKRLGKNINYESIENLDLSHLSLTELPKDFTSKFQNLKTINLSYNNLKNLDEDIFIKNKKLERIFLNGNNLENIPYIAHLVNLEMIDLSGNCLQSLPKDTFINLKNLKTIYLYNNKLENIFKETFSSLESLQNLDATENSGGLYNDLEFHKNYYVKTNIVMK